MAIGSPQWMYKSGEAYTIDQSLKFNDDDTAYLSKTFASSGNTKKWTYSCWYKRGDLDGQSHTVFSTARGATNDFDYIRVQTDDSVYVAVRDNSSNYVFRIITNRKLRDPSAWYHILVKFDSTASTPSSTDCALYINGVRETDLAGEILPSQNDTTRFNSNVEHHIGQWNSDSSFYLDGHLAEVNFIDGQALNPSDFGETGTYGEWKPIEYSGTYGTNGFYLPFKQDYTVEGFSTTLFKGVSGESRYVGGSGFRPSLTWLKSRTNDYSHSVIDAVRGSDKTMYSNATNAEDTNNYITGFKPDGFQYSSAFAGAQNYVAWQWDMGANTPTGFSIVLSKGNATARNIGNVGFSPDLVWNKTRSANQNHFLYDRLRGAGKELRTNQDSAEGTNDGVESFDPDGFSRGSSNDCNENNITYVDYCWDMGGTSATNTDGGITSTVMANTTYGQSIVTYTGTGSASSVGHGLDSAPDMVILKRRNASEEWSVYHTGINPGWKIYLNGTAGEADDSSNETFGNLPSSITSTTFGVGTHARANASGSTYVAYCFHDVTGYSKFSKYSGSGSSGNTITTGFRPAFVMIKDHEHSGENWYIFDSTREPLGELSTAIKADESVAEVTSSTKKVEFTSTGFKLNSTNNALNGSGHSYIYMAFAGGMDSISEYNTDGTIDSRVKANPTYGQSIVSYQGTNAAGITVGHGLDSAPEVIIAKNREESYSWITYHASLPAGGSYNAEHYILKLESTAAEANNDNWADTAPTSSVFSLGADAQINPVNKDCIAYCFHSVTGYSKFNRYSGDGTTDGSNAVNCGFEPAFVMIKCTNDTESWWIFDNARNPFNGGEDPKRIASDSNNAEVTGGSTGSDWVEFTSTGFKMTGSGGGVNGNGNTYVYMAFADKREYAYWLDQSGNNNDWTSNNLTESNISVDSPTNNFATLNPLDKNGTVTFSQGNTYYVSSTGMTRGTMAGNANDKFYLEYCVNSGVGASNPVMIGIGAITEQPNHESNHIASVMCHLDGNSQKRVRIFLNNAQVQTTDFDALVGFNKGDILQFAYDGTSGKVWVGLNGNWLQGNPATGTSPIYTFSDTSHPMTAFVDHAGVAHAGAINFGQDSSFSGLKTAQGNTDDNGKSDFYYEPPSGFLALSSENLKDSGIKPSEHFDVVTYTGNGGSKTISGYNFQPDMVWGKARSHAYNGHIHDAVRGVEKRLAPPTADIEYSDGALKTFTSDGYTFDTAGAINVNGTTYVNWAWKANGSGSSNTDGSVTTTTSANVDAGFSIIKYTGSGSGTITIGHGLSKAPEFWVTKPIGDVSDNQWFCCHKDFASDYYTDFNHWDNNSPVQDSGSRWGDTAPTSSVITVGSTSTNNSGDYICYAWHSVDGYSKIGYWIGNGNSNGVFVYTGFRPKLVICKDLNNSQGWQMFDSVRSPNNPMDERLLIDLNNAEQTNVTAYDFLSNGFKIRTTDGSFNSDSTKYIYMAFAEIPQKYSHAR